MLGAIRAATTPLEIGLQLLESAIMLLAPTWLLYAGTRVSDAISRGRRWTVVLWLFLLQFVVVGTIVAVQLHRSIGGDGLQGSLIEMELLAGAGLGAGMGVLVGWHRATAAEQTDRLREQRDALLYLHRLLRHHVLNGLNVIDGYAGELDERTSGADRRLLEPIRERSRTLESVVTNVRLVIETFTDRPPIEPVDLRALLEGLVRDARREHPDADIDLDVDLDLPDPVQVRANDLLGFALAHLLENAIRHHDRATPHVRVEATPTETPGRVRVRVLDDGPGVTTEDLTAIDDTTSPPASGEAGLGLYLAERLFEQFGASFEVEENQPRGTVVTVTLELADPTEYEHGRCVGAD
jgi:signal transduction histidine kinase